MAKMTYQEAAGILKECKNNESYPHVMLQYKQKEALEMGIQALDKAIDIESLMRGLYEEMQVGEQTYTTKEVYEMLMEAIKEKGDKPCQEKCQI